MLIAIENGTGNALYAGGDLYFGNGYLQGSMGMDSHLTPDNCTLVDVSYHPPYIVTDDTGVEKTITPDNILSPDPWMGGGAWAFDGSRFVLTDYGKKQIAASKAKFAADTIAKLDAAIQAYYDSVAQADKWDNRYTCIARVGYPNPWQSRAMAFAQWMDQCNAIGYRVQSECEAGTRAIPTAEELIGMFPAFRW